jgi:NAD-dependent histone deacetylase SIR2
VGDFGRNANDVVCLGKCDDIVQKLCKDLGWEEELMIAWEKTKDTVEVTDGPEKSTEKQKREEKAVDEVEKLASEMERSLALDSAVISKDSALSIDHSPGKTPQDVNEAQPQEHEKASPAMGRQTGTPEESDISKHPDVPRDPRKL